MKTILKLCCVVALAVIPLVPATAQEKAPALTREQVKKEFMYACLETSQNKYELYSKCIGDVTEVCASNYNAYEPLAQDLNAGSAYQACLALESVLWKEIGGDLAKKLTDRLTRILANPQQEDVSKDVIDSLKENLATLDKRGRFECDYVSSRAGGGNQNLYDGFACDRNISAENAITIYIWNKELRSPRS